MNNKNSYDVIIIGAGPAGIGACLNLSKGKISYVVLEARDRIGGRLFTKQIDGVFVDIGASWIHAFSDQNPINKYVNQLGIKQVDFSDRKKERILIDQNSGNQFNKQYIEAALLKSKQFLASSKQFALKSSKDISVQQASKNYTEQKLNKQAPVVKKCTQLILNSTERHQGSTIKQISAKHFDYNLDHGVNFLPQGGYGQLYKKIATLSDIKVQFYKVVKSILYDQSRVIVECTDGSSYTSKKIICSLPLGVLKSKKVKFQPQLPKQYQLSIERLGNGLMNKIIVSFEANFWGPVQWINIACEERRKFSQIYNLSQKGKNILCCFLTADWARKLQGIKDQLIIQEFLQFLYKIFGKQNVKMKQYIITRWGKQQHSLGSFSSYHVGSSPQDSYRLRKPILDTMWFAGQHCYAEYIGTAHGAFKTGQLAAKQTIQCLRRYSQRLNQIHKSKL